MSIRILSTGLLFALGLAGSATAQDAAPQGVARFMPPKLAAKQPNVSSLYPYPPDRDALVYVRFDLTAAGKVENAAVNEGGFYDKRYADAALKIVRKLNFTPATRDGVAVDYSGCIPIRFNHWTENGRPTQGITPEFRSEALKVQQLIEQKDLAAAHHHAQWMLAEKVQLTFEFAVLQAVLADTHARTGNPHLALSATREVTRHTGMSFVEYQPGGSLPQVSLRDYVVTREILERMLRLRFVLATSQGFYLDAARAHADLQALDLATDADPTMEAFRQLLTALQTGPALRGTVRLDEDGNWKHALWFRNFAVRSVRNGSLQQFRLACADYTRILKYAPDVEWSVPSKWGECELQFGGAPGTEFEIMEYRERPTASPMPASSDVALSR